MTTETARAFYNRQGWNPGFGHRVKTQGRLVVVMVDGKERIDVEASQARYEATKDPAKGYMAGVNDQQRAVHRGTATPPPLPEAADKAPPGGGFSQNATYMQAKTAAQVYDAKNAQLEYEERSGKLIRVDAVKAALAAAFTSTRDNLLQIPSRLSAILAAETDAAKVHELLQAELYRALEGMSAVQNSNRLAGREQAQ